MEEQLNVRLIDILFGMCGYILMLLINFRSEWTKFSQKLASQKQLKQAGMQVLEYREKKWSTKIYMQEHGVSHFTSLIMTLVLLIVLPNVSPEMWNLYTALTIGFSPEAIMNKLTKDGNYPEKYNIDNPM